MRFIGKNQQKIKTACIFTCSCISLLVLFCATPAQSELKKKSNTTFNKFDTKTSGSPIQKLLIEKQQKMAQLEQCAKKVKGFQIAGISTLGLTAVGVAGNVVLATQNKKLDKKISDVQSSITAEEKKLNNLNEQIAEKQHKADEEAKKENECNTLSGKHWENNKCVDDIPETSTEIPTSGDTTENHVTTTTEIPTNETSDNKKNVDSKSTISVDGRIIGGACLSGDLPSKASSGTYYKLAREFTVEKDKWASKKCYASTTMTDVVDCSCAATTCTSNEFEVVNGICQKNGTTNPQSTSTTPSTETTNTPKNPTIAIHTIGKDCVAVDKPADAISNGVYKYRSDSNGGLKCYESTTNKEIVSCVCKDETPPPAPVEPAKGLTEIKTDNSSTKVSTDAYDISGSAIGYDARDLDGSGAWTNDCSTSKQGDWCAKYKWGTIKGTSACVSKIGSARSSPEEIKIPVKAGQNDGGFCLCKASFKGFSGPWVWIDANEEPDKNCESTCSWKCAELFDNDVDSDKRYRAALLGPYKKKFTIW